MLNDYEVNGAMLNDTGVLLRNLFQLVLENVNAFENTNKALGFIRSVTMVLSGIEAAINVKGLAFSVADRLQGTEFMRRIRTLIRFRQETINCSEQVTRARVMIRRILEGAATIEFAERIRNIIKIRADVASVSEIVRKLRNRIRLKKETLQGVETIVHPLSLRELFNALSRSIKAKVEVFFNGVSEPPETFLTEDLTSVSLLEEIKADTENPLGAVSANEAVVGFNNEERKMSPTNADGPFFGKLLPGTKVVVYIGAARPSGVTEYVKLGTFYTGDWRAPSDSMEAHVTAYDKLMSLGEKEVPPIPAQLATTIGDLLELVFEAIGLVPDNYMIDAALYNINVPFGYFPDTTVREVLRYIAQAGQCFVYVDRDERIRAEMLDLTADPYCTLSEDDQVITVEIPTTYLNTFSSVAVQHYKISLKPIDEVLQIDDIEVPTGTLVLNKSKFTTAPVGMVERVEVRGSTNTTVATVGVSPWTISLELSNTGAPETVSIVVFGRAIEAASSEKLMEDLPLIALIGERRLAVENEIIQDGTYAEQYGTQLFEIVTNPHSEARAEIRGNPFLRLGQVVKLDSPVNKVNGEKVLIYRSTLQFEGALEGTIEGIRIKEVP